MVLRVSVTAQLNSDSSWSFQLSHSSIDRQHGNGNRGHFVPYFARALFAFYSISIIKVTFTTIRKLFSINYNHLQIEMKLIIKIILTLFVNLAIIFGYPLSNRGEKSHRV